MNPAPPVTSTRFIQPDFCSARVSASRSGRRSPGDWQTGDKPIVATRAATGVTMRSVSLGEPMAPRQQNRGEHTSGQQSGWQFWIDRGGTFTDVVARRPDGTLVTHKLLSENPERYPDAAVAGIRHLLEVAADEPIPADRIEAVRLGTTIATNALLQRKGAPTVLVITRGVRDALRIGYQARPRIFDRHIVLPELLYDHVIEAEERISANGEVILPLNAPLVTAALQAVFDDGIRAAAVVCLHGYRYPAHEQRIAAIAREIGFP